MLNTVTLSFARTILAREVIPSDQIVKLIDLARDLASTVLARGLNSDIPLNFRLMLSHGTD